MEQVLQDQKLWHVIEATNVGPRTIEQQQEFDEQD